MQYDLKKVKLNKSRRCIHCTKNGCELLTACWGWVDRWSLFRLTLLTSKLGFANLSSWPDQIVEQFVDLIVNQVVDLDAALAVGSKAMRSGKSFELRYIFVKFFTCTERSKVNSRKSTVKNSGIISIIFGQIFGHFCCFWGIFWIFLALFSKNNCRFPTDTVAYQKFWYILDIIPRYVEIFETFGSIGKTFAKVKSEKKMT